MAPTNTAAGSSRAASVGSAPAAPAGHAAASATNATPKRLSLSQRSKRKPADPGETEKLLAAKISQLELDAAGEKDQEQEIEREVRKATRDLNNLLAGMGTPLERMEALQKRIADLMADMKRVEREHIKGKKRADMMQKERDLQRVELSKSNAVKEKLEKLAREFTKENKKLKEDVKRLEDNERRMREAGYMRDSAITTEHARVMETHRNAQPGQLAGADLDDLFRQKFAILIDQYHLRETHFQSVLRAKDDEIAQYQSRLENQKKVVDNETSRARQLTTQVSTFSQTESELRSQLNIYVEKFKQVEDTLNNSNDLFLTFRKEMEEMSKKTKRLEKENLTLTRKHDLTNRNIIEMAEEHTTRQRELDGARKKIGTLESIIRRMQEQGRGGSSGSGAPEASTGARSNAGARGPAAGGAAVGGGDDDDEDESEEGSESEYDSAEEEEAADEAGSSEPDDRASTAAAAAAAAAAGPKSRTYRFPPQPAAASPSPPPPPPPAAKRHGRKVNGLVNGGRRVEV